VIGWPVARATCFPRLSLRRWSALPLQSGKEMLSVLEATAKLSVSRDTIHRLIKAGDIKAYKKPFAPHSAYLIDRASVEAYDRERRALVS